MKIVSLFLPVLLLCAPVVRAQYTPLSPTDSAESRAVTAIPEKAAATPRFHYGNVVLGSAMVLYGITGLKSDGVQDINEKVQHEMWNEHSHAKMHLDNYLQWTPAVAVYGLGLAGVKAAHPLPDRLLIHSMSSLMVGSIVFASKKLTHEMRPDGTNLYSFPSGHTANAFAAAEIIRQEYGGASPWYAVGGYAVAFATGYLRLYNNRHWFSDVVAGAGVGMLSTDMAYYLYPSVKKLFSHGRKNNALILPSYQNGAPGVCAVLHL